MNHWQEKVVLITGGSAGLGLALARQFSRRRAEVVLVARGEEQLRSAVQTLQQAGGKASYFAADVTDANAVRTLFDDLIARHGRLDLLVNNVGKSDRGLAIETGPETLQQLWEINVLSAVHCTRAAAEQLKKTGGSIINIGSLAAKTASRYLGGYALTKFPLAAYSQQLRLEWGSEGPHVLLVCPGPIRRDDAGERYREQAANLPPEAKQPGAGVKLKGLDPDRLAEKIIRACEKRKPELVVPGKVRLLLAISQLFPSLGDWLLKKFT